MKTMLAAYLPGNSTVDLREVAVPTPGINQVLIKMKSSGICGSDVHYIYHQHRATAAAPDKPLYQGFINGHEPCGQIVAMGQGCRHFKEGDRVRLSVAALARPMKGFCAAKFPAAIKCWWSVWGRSA